MPGIVSWPRGQRPTSNPSARVCLCGRLRRFASRTRHDRAEWKFLTMQMAGGEIADLTTWNG